MTNQGRFVSHLRGSRLRLIEAHLVDDSVDVGRRMGRPMELESIVVFVVAAAAGAAIGGGR